jgi:hypothetical protein
MRLVEKFRQLANVGLALVEWTEALDWPRRVGQPEAAAGDASRAALNSIIE